MWDLSFLNQGSNPHPLQWKAKDLTHWTTREVPQYLFLKVKFQAAVWIVFSERMRGTQGREGLTCVPSKHNTNSTAILQWTGYQVDIHLRPNLIFTASAWANLDLIILLLHYKVWSQFKNDSSLTDPSCYAINEQWWLQALTSNLLFIWVLMLTDQSRLLKLLLPRIFRFNYFY